jgi:hypothetical protein
MIGEAGWRLKPRLKGVAPPNPPARVPETAWRREWLSQDEPQGFSLRRARHPSLCAIE